MATALKFDELNRLNIKNKIKYKSIPYKEFFGKMYISQEQMKERIALAEEIELVMLYVFAFWDVKNDLDISTQEIKDIAKQRLTSVFEKETKGNLDDYILNHINNMVDEVVDTTERHTSTFTSTSTSDIDDADADTNTDTDTDTDTNTTEDRQYWTSSDRAMLIAENEANSLKNYTEYRDAKTIGKTKKKWLTENDDKVRITHTLVEGKTVNIDGLFLVGNSLMRFPRDYEYDPDPSEVINCRCSCVYE